MSILVGGIAFESPAKAIPSRPAKPNTTFTLFSSRAHAFEPPVHSPQTYQINFNESVRGLEPSAPVECRGVKIGEVVAIRAKVDVRTLRYSVPVTIRLDAQRLGVQVVGLRAGTDIEAMSRKLIDSLIAHVVRAQLRTGSLLTGSAFVAFDFFPGAPPAKVDWSQDSPRLPTMPGALEATEMRLASVAQKLDKLPLKKIGDDLNKALVQLDMTLAGARGTLASAKTTLGNINDIVKPDSAQGEQLSNALGEVCRAARRSRRSNYWPVLFGDSGRAPSEYIYEPNCNPG